MTNKTETVHISQIQHGDTVVTNSGWATVSRKDISKSFIGDTLSGQRTKMVERVLFPMWKSGQLVGWAAQR